MWMFTSRALGFAACLTLVSSTASAQSGTTIAGTVKDASGAVLPGVTVEVASPALIEKVARPSPTATATTRSSACVPASTRSPSPCPASAPSIREGIELTSDFTAQRQRRDEGRHARRDDHRHRRIADRRHAEHHDSASS